MVESPDDWQMGLIKNWKGSVIPENDNKEYRNPSLNNIGTYPLEDFLKQNPFGSTSTDNGNKKYT